MHLHDLVSQVEERDHSIVKHRENAEMHRTEHSPQQQRTTHSRSRLSELELDIEQLLHFLHLQRGDHSFNLSIVFQCHITANKIKLLQRLDSYMNKSWSK